MSNLPLAVVVLITLIGEWLWVYEDMITMYILRVLFTGVSVTLIRSIYYPNRYVIHLYTFNPLR